jgi:hypothetical protein
MKGPFSKIEQPLNESEDENKEETIDDVQREIMKGHIKNLVKEVAADSGIKKITEEDINFLSEDPDILKLSERIFELETQSQPTIREGGYTNKEDAKLLRSQLASLIERKILDLEEKAA